ncbi:MAG: hypothetical protein E3J23_08610 [Candidatus Stahlbacteria bacterium]|nr:MAG: hypothetical protein E3J23_08610 [Candidatus Stahlbacteria bacterium]
MEDVRLLESKITGLYDLAYRAFSGTSFSPEKRAESTVEWVEAQLKEDLEKILNESGSTGNYREKFINHVHTWLNAKSRCMSSMITGPANFPVARNQKNMRYEDNAYKNWDKWRERYIKSVFRVPTPSPEEDLDKALKDYEKTFQNQELMKTANKILRRKSGDHSEKRLELVEAGFSEKVVDEGLMKPDCYGDYGFASYSLTNNNAKIKRLKEKVLTMKSRIAVKASFEPIRFDGGEISIDNDRVVISHDEKPEQSIIDHLKSRGFRWSRNYGAWSRKHTANALYTAKIIVGVSV